MKAVLAHAAHDDASSRFIHNFMEKPYQLLLFLLIQLSDEAGNPYIVVRQDVVHFLPPLVRTAI